MVDIHKAIRQKFHLSNKTIRNLPYCSGQRFNRTHLAELLGELNFDTGAEIGVRRGTFSEKLCQCNEKLKLFCIDPWGDNDPGKYPQEKQEQIFQYATKRLANYNATIIRKYSMEAVVGFGDESLDFVYIDGDHHFDFVAQDIIEWSKKVRAGGVVACHDVYSGEVGVQQAVHAYVISHDIKPWYVTKELAPTAYWVKP